MAFADVKYSLKSHDITKIYLPLLSPPVVCLLLTKNKKKLGENKKLKKIPYM